MNQICTHFFFPCIEQLVVEAETLGLFKTWFDTILDMISLLGKLSNVFSKTALRFLQGAHLGLQKGNSTSEADRNIAAKLVASLLRLPVRTCLMPNAADVL